MAGLDDMSLDQLLALRDQTLKSDPDVSEVHQIESSGAPDTQTGITNPASSALGSMQVLAGTRRDPGYGVTPSSGTPQDDARTGRDYYAALRGKYGDSSTAALAYSWGPGNVDHWLSNGGDLNALPLPQLDYLRKFTANHPKAAQPAQPSVPGVTDNPIPQPQPEAPGGGIEGFAAGVGQGFGNAALGAQALAGKGVGLVAPETGAAIVNDARTGSANLANQAAAAGANGLAGDVGRMVGGSAPLLFAGPELAPQIIAGGAYGATQGALNDTGILPGAIEGAGLGAGGYVAGKGISALGAAAAPLATRALNAVRGNTEAAASRVGNFLGDDLDSVISNLDANSNEIVPGSAPTAGEVGGSTRLVALQRQAQNTAQGQIDFTDRFNTRNAARLDAANAAVGPNLSQEAQDFTNAQAQRIAAGQTELPPVTQAQADAMQSPAYAQAIKSARTLADNRLSTVFEDQQAPLLDNLRQGIDRVAGTPETIDALKEARGSTADQLFGQADVSVPTSWPEFTQLNESPTFQRALRYAETASADLREGPAISTDPHGGGTWVSGNALLHAKGFLDDEITNLLQRDKPKTARPIIAVRDRLVALMDKASPDYAPARAQFAAESGPIDAQQALQTRLNGTVDPLTGAVSPNRLRQTINSVVGEQLKPGIRKADQVLPQTLSDLRDLALEARRTPTNLTGLPGEGQELLRQSLADRARSGADSLFANEARGASEDFNQQLAQNSPSYRQFFNEAGTTGEDIRSRQILAEGLDRVMRGSETTDQVPILTQNAAKNLVGNRGQEITGNARAVVDQLIADLSRSSSVDNRLGAAGSQTFANAQLGGGLIGRLAGTAGLTTAGGIAGGFTGAAVGLAARAAIGRVAQKTEKEVINLLLNPKKLAAALREFKNQPTARAAFIDALKQKASGAGRAGVRAVQAYEAVRTQNGEKRQ